jgi:hypothetical protein
VVGFVNWRGTLEAMKAKLFACAVLLVACDPAYSVTGTVVDGKGAPIAGASVTMSCPSGSVRKETTGASGEFQHGGVGGTAEAPSCTLRIEAAGFVPQTIPSTAVCFRSSRKGNYGKPCSPERGQDNAHRLAHRAPHAVDQVKTSAAKSAGACALRKCTYTARVCGAAHFFACSLEPRRRADRRPTRKRATRGLATRL